MFQRFSVRAAALVLATGLLALGMNGAALADDLEDAVAAADADAGARMFRQCSACHTVEEGAPNRVGPNLYDIVGRQVGSLESYNYSDTLADAEDYWTLESLDAYIENPNVARPGNRMTFAGLRNDAQRMAVLAYLTTLGATDDEGDADDAGGEESSEDAE